MYGSNPIKRSRPLAKGFSVTEIWHTLQGEGPFSGWPAIFVRFAGCNLRCFWCDTEFDERFHYELLALAEQINHQAHLHPNTRLIVFTGGEPMLQSIFDLVQHIVPKLRIQIETAGTVWPERETAVDYAALFGRVYIVCSPKTPKVHEKVIENCGAWKYVVGADDHGSDDGLPIWSTQIQGKQQKVYRPPTDHPAPIYVSPRDDADPELNAKNQAYATRVALQHGYRLSLQVHKLVGVA